MRVAVVVRSLNMGGMQRAAISLAESFAHEGHESHLIYFKEKNRVFTPDESVILHHFNLQKLSILSGVGIFSELFSRFLNIFIRNSYFLWSAPFLSFLFRYRLKFLEKQYGRFDLIVMRGQGTFETLWPIKDPRYFQITESMFIPSDTSLKRFYFKFLYHQKNVICVSHAIQERLLAVYKQSKNHPNSLNIIGNPLKSEDIRKKADAYVPEIHDSYILSVGRVTPNKNISLLIDAYILLRHQDKITQKLVIIGTGHNLDILRCKAENSPYKDSIFFIGQISNPYPWMKHADLFILSSKLEGLGMVLLEALACGTKVISTKSQSGILDIMRGDLTRYLCEQNPESMANLIKIVLHEENILDFESCLTPFSPKTIVQDFEKLVKFSHSMT